MQSRLFPTTSSTPQQRGRYRFASMKYFEAALDVVQYLML